MGLRAELQSDGPVSRSRTVLGDPRKDRKSRFAALPSGSLPPSVL
jgi:hypothetical protein